MKREKFYVIVNPLKAIARTIPRLSGQLRAKTFSDAEIEVGLYRSHLNRKRFQFIVQACNEFQAQFNRKYEKFKDNQPTRSIRQGQKNQV